MKSHLTALLLADAVKKYSEDQPRDDHGRFGSGGSGASEVSHERYHVASGKAARGEASKHLKSMGFKATRVQDLGHGTRAGLVTHYSHPDGHTAQLVSNGAQNHLNVSATDAVHEKLEDRFARQ
jgi:hypothetical protein